VLVQWFVAVMDVASPEEIEREQQQRFKDHVVMLGFNDASYQVT
jgi:hypothetical protein